MLCTSGCADQGVEPGSRGTTITRVLIGELVEIRVYNASADGGYLWEITKDFAQAIAVLEEYETEVVGDTLIGGPVYQVWKYRTKSAGITSMEVTLRRPWESLPGIDHKQYQLIVL
jgi:predicted secreted protein